MKYIGLVLVTLWSFNVFAVSDDFIADFCFDKGISKIASQAKAYGCEVNIEDVYVDSVDNRFYNPNKYIWYKAAVICEDHQEIQKMVRYTRADCY